MPKEKPNKTKNKKQETGLPLNDVPEEAKKGKKKKSKQLNKVFNVTSSMKGGSNNDLISSSNYDPI